ncbi:MAG: DUF58 domain-containing protein [Thermoguttaceae bacterium]|nr:DUF58 domain-containing protein [Thermoguttaceae bacterium]MDW8038210.1 DUF58 domain-containing protein [Thermoguttaceae bacterium]
MAGVNKYIIRTSWTLEGLAYLAVVLVVLAGAWVRQINLLFMVAGLMAGPLLWSWLWGGRQLQGISLRRRLPRSVCAGDLLVVELEVENTRSRGASWALVIEEQIRHDTQSQIGTSAQLYLAYLPAGARQTASYRGRLPQRGRYLLGPIRLSSRFPFGLFRHTVEVGGAETLIVYPRIGRLSRRWAARHQQAFEGIQRREVRSGRAEADFYGVRPWQSGDSRRWIHWRATAHHQALVVRQFEQFRSRDLVIVLDLFQTDPSTADQQQLVECGVSFAATLLAQACRQGGNRLGLAIAGQEPVWLIGQASTGLLEEAMTQLALAYPAAEDRLLELLTPLAETLQPGAEVVLISLRASEQPDQAPVAELRSQLARRLPGCQIHCFGMHDPQLADYFLPE